MPQAIPVIIAVMTQSVVQIVFAVVTAALTTYAQIKARRDARNAYNASLRDRTLTLRSAVSPRRLLLGQTRIGGTLVYADTVGTNQRMFDSVIAVCDGPIDSFVGYYLNEDYFAWSDLSGDRPSTGKYATSSTRSTGVWRVTLSGTNTITLPNPPAGTVPPDLIVNGRNGGPNTPLTTLAVASVSGNVVTLAAPFSGETETVYRYIGGDAPLRIQAFKGDQTTASTWSGVTTPKWGANDVLRGIANVRTLMGWDENIYTAGPPTVNLLGRGVFSVYDPRLNLSSCASLANAVVGAPGTLPDGIATTPSAGMALAITSTGTDPRTGWPFVDFRLTGTATATDFTLITLPKANASPSAANGETWSARLGLAVVGGTWNLSGSQLQLLSYINQASVQSVVNTAITAAPNGGWVNVTGTISRAGATHCSSRLRLSVTNGTTYDCTLRLHLPQLWRGVVNAAEDPIKWTSNSALLAAWYARLPRSQGGCGRPWARINWPSVITAANICDEGITVKKRDGTGYETIKRYECHTVLSTEDSPGDNLRAILSSMAGEFPFTAGQYTLYAGAFVTPTITLTDDDVVTDEPIRIYPDAGSFDSIPNMATAKIVDAAQNYIETTPPPVVNATYVASDGGVEEPLNLNLTCTTDARQANYLMGVELERRRPRFMAELTVWGAAGADIAIKRGVMLDLEGYEAFDGFTWEVRKRTNHFNGRYTLLLRQTLFSSYLLDADRYNPIIPPLPVDLSYLWSVPALTGLAGVLASQSHLPDGSSLYQADVSWTQHPQGYVRESGRIEVRWREALSDAYAGPITVFGGATSTRITLGATLGVRYIVEARAVNGVGSVSSWTALTLDPALPAVPANVSGLALAIKPGAMVASWARPTDPAPHYAATELRLVDSGWGSTPANYRGKATEHAFLWITPGATTVYARHIDTFGQPSATSASATITVDDAQLINTGNVLAGAITAGDVQTTSTYTGSSGAGLIVTGGVIFVGPITCEAGDQLDLSVSCEHRTTLYFDIALFRVSAQLQRSNGISGTKVNVGKAFNSTQTPEPSGNTTKISATLSAVIDAPGAGTDWYYWVDLTVTSVAATGSNISAQGPDYEGEAEWRIVRRKR
jgi:hypothetical protein